MLERFKVPKHDEVRVAEGSLRRAVTSIFEKMDVSLDDASEGADVLVTADLRGVETHGVSNMLRMYVDLYNAGALNPKPNWRVVRESLGTATIDADRGLGILMGRRAMEMAMDKARQVGFGVVTMHNSGHMGPIGHFAMLAAQQDMVGMCAVAAGTGIVPTYASEPRFGDRMILVLEITAESRAEVKEPVIGARLGHFRVRGRKGLRRTSASATRRRSGPTAIAPGGTSSTVDSLTCSFIAHPRTLIGALSPIISVIRNDSICYG